MFIIIWRIKMADNKNSFETQKLYNALQKTNNKNKFIALKMN